MNFSTSGQMPLLPSDVFREEDRNFEKGGRSFYFFDFDDNVIHLATKIVLFHSHTGEEVHVATSEYPQVHSQLGKKNSPWEHFVTREADPYTGSYRNFRELPPHLLGEKHQPLIQDMLDALSQPFLEWRGPSWDFFVKAVNNNRPVAIITARGNAPHTIRRAINILRNSRDLANCPNYVSVYPVSHPETRKFLGDTENKWGTALLKKAAIKAAVKDAFECYGQNPHHRFGMSDDDPSNVALILEAMKELKQEYPENAFFVINTHGRNLVKEEVLVDGTRQEKLPEPQMELFKTK
ncbi:MAG: hypothetical protein JST16_12170 [Bdellovibrionales bacterium]|nr:hypothetical protein [Bdellovibrionales bacterium]